MAENIDEITINYEEDGVLLVKELEKEVLTKGAWTTILFKFQQWMNKDQVYSDEKYTIRRYKKSNGEYKQQSKFNISSKKQALQVIEILGKWTA